MTVDRRFWQLNLRHAATATLLVIDWARQDDDAALAAAVAGRLSNPNNELPPSILVSIAVKIAEDLLRSRLDADEFDRWLDSVFAPTGATLATADLVRAARVADDMDAFRAVIEGALRGYGGIHCVIEACNCLRNTVAFAYHGQPVAVLESWASMVAGKVLSGEFA